MPFVPAEQPSDYKILCSHPEHKPPMHIVLPAGRHKYICPACGEEYIIDVPTMMSKHTPGPWEFDGTSYIWADMSSGKMIAQIRGWGWLQKKGEEAAIAEQEANAHLIAAAPELLEACASIVVSIASKTKYLEGCDCADCQSIRLVYAAIAKAEGTD
jgi:hypothetical protein